MDIKSIGSMQAAMSASVAANTPSRRDLLDAVQAISASNVLGDNRELNFVLDRVSHTAIMQVIDRTTNEVIMQVPAEYLLQLAKELKQKG